MKHPSPELNDVARLIPRHAQFRPEPGQGRTKPPQTIPNALTPNDDTSTALVIVKTRTFASGENDHDHSSSKNVEVGDVP